MVGSTCQPIISSSPSPSLFLSLFLLLCLLFALKRAPPSSPPVEISEAGILEGGEVCGVAVGYMVRDARDGDAHTNGIHIHNSDHVEKTWRSGGHLWQPQHKTIRRAKAARAGASAGRE